MTLTNPQTFRTRLVHELTALDAREAAAETRRRLRVNIYRIAHYLRAADDVMTALMTRGQTAERAFADAFVATRGMHTVARRLGLNLDVAHGEWIVRV